MKKLLDKTTIWNIFDHTDDPEWRWELLRKDIHAARKEALRLTLSRPFTMLPVIARCFALNFVA